MGKIRVYDYCEIERQRLSLFKTLANSFFDERYTVTVETTYFDFGQNWKYTALITYDNKDINRHWQSVCPRDYELIISTDSITKMRDMAKYYVNGIIEGNICVNLFEKFE